MTTFSTRQTFALVALFVATSLAFIQLDDRRALDPLKEGLAAVVSPAVGAFSRVGPNSSGDTELERRLAVVMAERDQLAAENAGLKADLRELGDLREQAKLQQDNPSWKMLQARVQSPDPTSLQKFLVIDRGEADKVEVGMAVVAQGKNYIGRIDKVWEHAARVMLVIDASQRVGARLDSGPDGIVVGMWQNSGVLELRYLDRDAEPQPGEHVLTSDNAATSTARVPGNLLIGRVSEKIERNRQQDTQTVEVLPLVDFEKLQVVTVVQTSDDA